MTEENKQALEKAGVETVVQLKEWLSQAGDFVKDQAPALANEILLRGQIQCVGFMIAGLLLVVVGLTSANFLFKRSTALEKDKSTHDDGAAEAGIGLVSLVVSGVSQIMFCVNVYWLVMICLTPKLYILEQVSEMLK